MTEHEQQRLDELLVMRATVGLDTADDAELEWRLAQARIGDPEMLDRAAAYYWLGADGWEQPMPRAVADRAEDALTGDAPGPAVRTAPRPSPAARGGGGRWAWVAAAAALVLAVAGWWPQGQSTGESRDLAEARDQLLSNAPDAERIAWDNTDHPRGQKLDGGYVVWSDERQKGYMTFRGIPDNDPSEHQYQLWVFDKGRSDQYPVNGGVFNARGGEEVIIPIENKLRVEQAKMFAVTLEPPGGVVVSERDPVLWIANAGERS